MRRGGSGGRSELSEQVEGGKAGRGKQRELGEGGKEGDQGTDLGHIVGHIHHGVLQQRAGHHWVGQPLHARLAQPCEWRVRRQRQGPRGNHGRRGALRGRVTASTHGLKRHRHPQQTDNHTPSQPASVEPLSHPSLSLLHPSRLVSP